MAWHLLAGKPLPESMWIYWHLNPWKKIVKFYSKIHLFQESAFWKVILFQISDVAVKEYLINGHLTRGQMWSINSSHPQGRDNADINPSIAGPVYMWEMNLVIIVPPDVLAPNGASPSAGTMLTSTRRICFEVSLIMKESRYIFCHMKPNQNNWYVTVTVLHNRDASPSKWK